MYEDIKSFIRDVPDFPKPGILFKDITPALQDKACFAKIIATFAEVLKDEQIDKIAAIESRGYLFGAPLALKLGCGLVLLRKPGKLPSKTIKEYYNLEYGSAALEIHQDAIREGERILIIDDLLATGGTAEAACKLVQRLKGKIVATCFLIELKGLGGVKKLSTYAKTVSLLQ
ncbi:MAG: adenine phosphoribosyltransferase [Alphaproteobacteria bacterium]|nr:adenine phosphoribosyltransferase [Alphaproteobacteria bacterium]